jgi:CelD/BcsL family acetyltransferase involved in cellulose biosynthesis
MKSGSNNITMTEPELSACQRNDLIGVQVSLFDSFEETSFLQKEWDEFMESIEGGISLTYDWCRSWWKYYGQKSQLMIFVFRYQGEICAILPMFFEKVAIGIVGVSVVKMVGTDFTTTTTSVPIGRSFISKVLQILLEELRRHCRWDIFYMGPICGRSDSFEELRDILLKAIDSTYHAQVKNSGEQIYFKVAPSWDEQISGLTRENRRGMRRSYEKIIQQGVPLNCVHATIENFGQIFDNFVQLHQSHWNKIGKTGHFEAWPDSYDFHREVALIQLNRNRLKLYEINLNGQCIGYQYTYKFASTYYAFLFARKKFDKSEKIDFFRINFGEMIKQALKEDVKWVDTTRGKYEYELKLGGRLFQTRHIYIQPNKLLVRIRIVIFRSLAWMLNVAYIKLWRMRIAPRFHVKLGKFWLLWLKTNALSY